MTRNDSERQIIELEKKFWNSIKDNDSDTAVTLLTEPALMVSSNGAMKFDHAGYRNMADSGAFKLLDFKMSKTQVVFPRDDVAVIAYQVDEETEMKGKTTTSKKSYSSTWVREGTSWKCVVHTESTTDE